MNRINPDSDYAKKCIETANDPVQQKRYGEQLTKMAENARKWKAEHPDADVMIKWGPDPRVCVIAPIDSAVDDKIVQANEQGLELLKSMWPWDDEYCPTVNMCKSALEHVYDPKVPECACPYCGKVLDDATAVHGQGEKAKPTPGDVSLCIDCGGLIEFDQDCKLMKMRDETWKELDEPTQRTMKTAQSFIREMRK